MTNRCKICNQKDHIKTKCWMRYVLLDDKNWRDTNCGSPLQIDLCKVIKSPRHKSDSKECPICFEKILETNCATTPCGHKFCVSCIIKAGRANNNCPLCRQPLTDKPIISRRLLDLPPLPLDNININSESDLPPLLPRGRELMNRIFRRNRQLNQTF